MTDNQNYSSTFTQDLTGMRPHVADAFRRHYELLAVYDTAMSEWETGWGFWHPLRSRFLYRQRERAWSEYQASLFHLREVADRPLPQEAQ